MTRIAVNCECARNGGTRNHLRAILAAAPDGTFLPVFRTADRSSFTLAEPPQTDVDAALPLAERLAWERRILPRAIADLRPDVLLQPSNLGLMRRLDVPRVQILHNVAPLVRPLRSLARGRLLARFAVLRALTLAALRSASGVVFLSQLAADLVRERGYTGPAAIIRPGLDPSPLFDGPRDNTVVVVAHLFRYKRVEDAIAGFARSGLAHDGYRLDIYGGQYDGPYVAELRAAIDASGAASAITLAGSRPPSEVRAAVRRAAAVLQPSACENAPQIVYEAVADRTPIVLSDIPAHRELVSSGLHPSGDAEAIASLLHDAVGGRLHNVPVVPLGSWADSAAALAAFCGSVATA